MRFLRLVRRSALPVVLLLLGGASGLEPIAGAPEVAAAPLLHSSVWQPPASTPPIVDGKPLEPPPGCQDGRFFQMSFDECRADGYVWWVFYNLYVCTDGRVFRHHRSPGASRSDERCDPARDVKPPQPDGWMATPDVRPPSPPRDQPGGGDTQAPCQSPVPVDPEYFLRCLDGFRWLVRYDRVRCADGSIRRIGGLVPVSRREPLEPCDDQREVRVRVMPDGRVVPIPRTIPFDGRLRIQLRLPLEFRPQDQQQSAVPQQGQKKTLVGLVVPDYKPGAGQTAQISGTVTTEPEKYASVPGLKVQLIGEVTLPPDQNGKPTLQGTVVDTGDGQERPATRAFPILLDKATQSIPILVTAMARGGQEQRIVERALNVERTARPPVQTQPPTPTNYQTSPVCAGDGVTQIEGPLDGNSGSTQVHFDDKPAHIVAESPEGVFVEPPADMAPGAHNVSLREETPNGPVETSFEQVVVTKLSMSADKTTLIRGERTKFKAVVSGPEQIPASAWENDGLITLRLENKSSNITMKGEKNQVIEKKLKRGDFRNGPYTFDGELQSKQAGGFTILGEVTPQFKRIRGKERARVAR